MSLCALSLCPPFDGTKVRKPSQSDCAPTPPRLSISASLVFVLPSSVSSLEQVYGHLVLGADPALGELNWSGGGGGRG